jgi:two-component system cell cycle response regulator CpdR
MTYDSSTIVSKVPPLDTGDVEAHHLMRNKQGAHPVRSLVVDDDNNIIKFVAYMLSILGFQKVDTAQKNPELLKKLATGPYDLLVTDLEMPDMNGFDLTQKIKREAHGTKVIIMTGRQKGDCLAMMDAQLVDGWLFKPFGLNDLRHKLIGLGLSEHRHLADSLNRTPEVE